MRQTCSALITVGVLLAVVLMMPTRAQGQTEGEKLDLQANKRSISKWRDMRFGMFIHWGPVSLKGTEIGWSRGRQVPEEEYDQLYKRFNPVKFDADEWVQIAKDAGMKYLVITSKHHDGFCIWPSKYTDYDIGNTPFKRDILKELSNACKRHGLSFCTYHSICDWYHPDYPLGSPGGKSEKANPNMPRYYEYLKNQTREILKNYGPLGIMWFDGEWEQPWTREYGNELYAYLRGIQPSLIINNRVSKGRRGMAGTTEGANLNAGDYDTPEQRIGKFQNERPWETCMTICRQWAWKPNDEMKSLKQCIQTLVRVVGGDGNFLFNVGPMPDGRIEPRQVERLREMGAWLEKYGKTIYARRGGPFKPGPWGASTHWCNIIYVHVLNWPGETLRLPPISKEIRMSEVMTGGTVSVKQSEEGIEISVPEADRDEIDTIVVLRVMGPASEIPPCSLPSESLAAGKKAKASNVFQKNSHYGPAMALDDDDATRWATDSGTHEAWLEVDLGKAGTFDQVKINEAYGRVRKFELQYESGGEWVTFHEGRRIGERFSVKFKPVTARRGGVKILEATDGPTIWDFQLIAPEKAKP